MYAHSRPPLLLPSVLTDFAWLRRATNRNHTRQESHKHQAPAAPRTPNFCNWNRDVQYTPTTQSPDTLPTELQDQVIQSSPLQIYNDHELQRAILLLIAAPPLRPTEMSAMLMSSGAPAPPGSEGKLYRGGATKRQTSPAASPLQLFVRAKKRINDIYSGMDDYVADVARFVAGERRVEWEMAGWRGRGRGRANSAPGEGGYQETRERGAGCMSRSTAALNWGTVVLFAYVACIPMYKMSHPNLPRLRLRSSNYMLSVNSHFNLDIELN